MDVLITPWEPRRPVSWRVRVWRFLFWKFPICEIEMERLYRGEFQRRFFRCSTKDIVQAYSTDS